MRGGLAHRGHRALAPRAAQRLRDQLLGALALGAAQQLLGLAGRVAELEQPVARERRAVPLAAARDDRRRPAPAPPSTPTFSRSSTMIRSAVRLPIPGTAWKRAASPAAIAADQLARRARRRAPPARPSGRPPAPTAASGTGRAPARSESRTATSASSRTIRCVCSVTCSPTAGTWRSVSAETAAR